MNEYLWEFAQAFPSENRFQVLLKSALSMTAAARADVGKTNYKWMCRKCKTLWMHGCFRVEEVAGTGRYDKLIEKHEDGERRSRKQQKHFEYMQSRRGTTAIYTCTICSYKTRLPVKDTSSKPQPQVLPKTVTQTATPTGASKKNRKRRKDPTAGLTISAPPTKKKHNVSQAIGSNKPVSFNSKQPSQLQALAAALKKKSVEPKEPVDRLKLMLK